MTWHLGLSAFSVKACTWGAAQTLTASMQAFLGGVWQHLQSLCLYMLSSLCSGLRANADDPGTGANAAGVFRIEVLVSACGKAGKHVRCVCCACASLQLVSGLQGHTLW